MTLGKLLPGQQVGVVLQGADDNLIARIEKVFQPVSQKVQCRSGTVGKDYLPAVSRVEPLGDFAARVLKRLGGMRARQVLGPVHIGGATGVVVRQCVEQGLRFLRGGSVVQISLVLTLQGGDGRKVSAPGRRQKHGVQGSVDEAASSQPRQWQTNA